MMPAMPFDRAVLDETLANARLLLLAASNAAGHWEGELSSSALSTATAVFALHQYREALSDDAAIRATDATTSRLIRAGLGWLALNQNADGGWGDTTASLSNVSTTMLCWGAFVADPNFAAGSYTSTIAAVERWLAARAGSLEPRVLAEAIVERYGEDHTFSVPILTMSALAGRLGPGDEAWDLVPALPFEVAAVPRRLFKLMKLPVVSYALPALIAIGQVRHFCRPSINPVARAARWATRGRTLRLLRKIQPAGGGFLEATPLTSFVVMSLASAGAVDHPVVKNGVEFLIRSARADGGWPIDTNLATWVTTLAINALATGSDFRHVLPLAERHRVRDWLLKQQYRAEHPYTLANPGGWAWTDLPGGVPDADDTPGALLALRHLKEADDAEADDGSQIASLKVRQAVEAGDALTGAAAAGVGWLLGLQNADGGIPTFCRGWGKLPFDRSSADLTAHTLRAWRAWGGLLPANLRNRLNVARQDAVRFLVAVQRPDGAWLPLWFGNQHAPDDQNPTYGTSRVLRAAFSISLTDGRELGWPDALRRGIAWLLAAQLPDGGWGGGPGALPSIEETALAVEALAHVLARNAQVRADISPDDDAWTLFALMDEVVLDEHGEAEKVRTAVARGVAWLIEHTVGGTRFPPSPVGFYFAKLWYWETLYPLVWTIGALAAATSVLEPAQRER